MTKKVDAKELAQAIREHIAYRANSDNVNLLWAGYLAALMVEGLLSADEYHDINDTLKNIGRDELQEIFLGLPNNGDGGIND